MVILVADDNADARESLRLLLSLEGHTVLEAVNGLQAVQIASTAQPDLVLMDLNMPVMDGLTAIRMLRAAPASSHIRIIVISGNGNDAEWRGQVTQCGCDSCFTKPLDFQSLRRAISAA